MKHEELFLPAGKCHVSDWQFEFAIVTLSNLNPELQTT